MTSGNDKVTSLEAAVAQRLSALDARISTAMPGSQARIAALFEQLIRLHDARLTLLDLDEQAPQEVVVDTNVSIYRIGTRFLRQSYRYLMESATEKGSLLFGRGHDLESIHAVTGIREGNTAFLTEIVPLAMSKQSAATVEVDSRSLSETLQELQESGHVLWAIFHSHRMKGPPQPSSVDIQLQRKLEAGGYKAIQAIWSDDGYIRFFSAERKFEVNVYGKGVEQVEDKLFRLIDV